MYDAQTYEAEVGAAAYGALDEIQAVNIPFDRSIAPWLLKGGEKGRFVSTEGSGEVGQRAR